MASLKSSVPEVLGVGLSLPTTSPRWITQLKSEQRNAPPPSHSLRPRENEPGLELLGVGSEHHSFSAERWKAWRG